MTALNGRPTKYTEDTIGRLEQAVSMGATFKLACMYAGITEETLSNWREKKVGFSERLRKAEGLAAVKWLAKIEQAASEGTWQAAAWKLERRYPQEYGRTVQEHQGKDGGPIQQTTEHTGVVEVRAVDYRHSIRALAPPEDVEAAG